MPDCHPPLAPTDGDRLRYLLDVGRLLSALPALDAMNEIARRTVPTFADWMAVDVLDPSGALRHVTAGDEPAPRGWDLDASSLVVAPMAGRTRVFGAITMVFDRSGRTHEEADLALASDVAQRAAAVLEADRVQELGATLDRALGVIGHDLRGPLGAIVVSAAVLRRKGFSSGDDKALLRIAASASRMTALINQLVDFSVLRQTGRLRLSRKTASVGDIARDIVDEVSALSRDARIQLVTEGDTQIECDPDRIADAVANLVRNAVQHGADRHARVHVRGTEDRILVSVENRGRPIPPDVQKVIFEPFRRADDEQEGSRSVGLGLYIVKSIAEAHGGGVEVTSDEQATTFVVWLPRRAITSRP